MQSLISHRAAAPSRKLRGKRRYFAAIARAARSFRLGIAADGWWDLWHYHADWAGWGNRRWRYRREHLRALAVVFTTIAEGARAIPGPFQLWLSIHGDDAGQDAVFLHSPNPNGTAFPVPFANVAWSDEGPRGAGLDRLLPQYRVRIGRVTWVDPDEPSRPRTSWLVYAAGIGVALE